MGTPFASQKFDVTPDIMTMAKAITNGSMPMGAVCVKDHIYETVTDNSNPDTIEFFHGYTYSGHPGSCAAGLASLEIYEEEDLFNRANEMSGYFLNSLFSLCDHPLVKDVRGIGMMGGVELHADGHPGKRGTKFQKELFWEGLHIKFTGDSGIVAPMFISEHKHIDEIIEKFRSTLNKHGN